MGCDGQDPCIRVGSNGEFGTNHLEKIQQVRDFVQSQGLQTSPHEVAAIVGVAYASSQVEGGQSGVPVKICLRPGPTGHTEYRVFTIGGKPLIDWRSTSDFQSP